MVLTVNEVIEMRKNAELNKEENKNIIDLIDTISYLCEEYKSKTYKTLLK